MSSTPRTWQRSRLDTPLGRARLRQPFRSPLLASRTAQSPAGTSTPALASTAVSTPSPASHRSAGKPFRSPLLTGGRGGTPASAEQRRGQREDTRTNPEAPGGPADLAASPVLRAATVASSRTDEDPTADSPQTDPSVTAAPPPAGPDGSAPLSKPSGDTDRPPPDQNSPPDQDSDLASALAAVDAEIARLESAGCRTEQLPLYIAALHQYNEVKDAAQLVMGRIAELDGVTVREVHRRYAELPPEERS